MKKLLLSLLVLGTFMALIPSSQADDQTPPSVANCKWPYHLVPGPYGKLICVRAIHN